MKKKEIMKATLIILALVIGSRAYSALENRISKEDYVNSWRQVAVQQMIDYRIPASITLSQGILESGSGNSDLAKKGNNHFGIKCHGWTGDKMYMDDDTANECFRMYATASESYLDHSKFLSGKSRYASLFSLEPTDYESWAQGLKVAGYATNPKYPQLLIEIIRTLKLDELDKAGKPVVEEGLELIVEQSNKQINVETVRTVFTHANNVKYIIAKNGDSFYKLSKEFNLGLWQLYRYNDFGARKDLLEEGDIIYLQPKRKHSKLKNNTVEISSPMSLRQISQQEAIKLASLLKMNQDKSLDQKIQKGEKVTLRK
jgi:hypothetical protein